jgi:hypothetical protein
MLMTYGWNSGSSAAIISASICTAIHIGHSGLAAERRAPKRRSAIMSEHRDVRLRRPHVSSGRASASPPGRRLTVCLILSAIICAGFAVQPLQGDEGSPVITRIEEDWVLKLGTPNADEIAPQVFIVTTPTGHLDGLHSVFEINNLSLPDFYGGGLQLQIWNGELNMDESHHDCFAALAEPEEQVTFTVQMRAWDGNLRVKVINGQSTTWGAFGADDTLKVSTECNLPFLSQYDPAKSAEFSRVGFAGHRVKKLALKEVRYYSFGALVNTDTAERVVHSHE